MRCYFKRKQKQKRNFKSEIETLYSDLLIDQNVDFSVLKNEIDKLSSLEFTNEMWSYINPKANTYNMEIAMGRLYNVIALLSSGLSESEVRKLVISYTDNIAAKLLKNKYSF